MQFHGIVSFSITDITVCFKYTIKYFNHPIESPKVIPSTAASPVLQTKGPIAESRVTRVASFFDGRMVGFRRFRKPIAAGCLVFLKLPSRPLMKKKRMGKSYRFSELVSKTTRNNPKGEGEIIPRNYECNDLPNSK